METLFGLFEGITRHLWMVSWQVAVLAGMIAVVELTVRKASPLFRYGLWMIVLVRLCVPVTFTVPESAERMVRGMLGIGVPTVDRLFAAGSPEEVTWDRADNGSVAGGTVSTVVTGPVVPEPRLWTSDAMTGFAWVLGFLTLAAIIIIRITVVMNRIRACGAVVRDDLNDLVRRRCVSLGIGRKVQLQYGDDAGVSGPATVGVLRPAILLPRKIADGWSIDELEPVIVHELVHVRRRDLLVNWLQVAVQAVFWFHPAVWYANHRLRTLRETVCDDHAVHHLDGARERYGAGLLRAVETVGRDRTLGLVGLFLTERKSDVGQRIGRIMSNSYRAVNSMSHGALLGLAITAGVGILLSCAGASMTGNAREVRVVTPDIIIENETLTQELKKHITETLLNPDADAFSGPVRLGVMRVDDNPVKEETIGGIGELALAVEKYTNITLEVDSNLLFDSRITLETPFIYITSDTVFEVTDIQARRFGEYLRNGGFAVVENGTPEFVYGQAEASLRQMLRDALGKDAKFYPIPNDHPLYHCFFDFDDGPPMGMKTSDIKKRADEGKRQGDKSTFVEEFNYSRLLEGIWLNNRLVAIYSDMFYANRWAEEKDNIPQLKLGLNMVVYALLQEGGMAAEVGGDANPTVQEGSTRREMDTGGTITEIEVRTNFEIEGDRDFIVSLSGLKVGEYYSSDQAQQVFDHLWRDGQLFSDIDINHEVRDDGIKVILDVEVLPGTNSIILEGFDEVKEDEVLSLTGLVRGMFIGPIKIARWKQQILDLYHERGFLSAEVEFTVTPVPGNEHQVDVKITANEGV
jgi:beta-lactamase regulating signal transducer with metallopeptidase domain